MLQSTGDTTTTGEAIIAGELMAIGQAEVQSVQTTQDGGIIASRDRHFACWPYSQLGGIAALLAGRLELKLTLVLVLVASELDPK